MHFSFVSLICHIKSSKSTNAELHSDTACLAHVVPTIMLILRKRRTQYRKSRAQNLLEVSLSVHCLVGMWPGLNV